jgi:hypothetical protein
MEREPNIDRAGARVAPEEEIAFLLHDVREDVLFGLLDNARFNERHVCLLLERRDLSTALLEQIAGRQHWMHSYRVRRGLAFHARVPLVLGLRLVRELHVADLVELTLAPSGAPAVRHVAEELVLSRVAQMPPSQKIKLARRGSGRIIGSLLADGGLDVLPAVLDSPFLNEGHVLRALTRLTLPAPVVAAIAGHGRWSHVHSVRLALLRHPQAPLSQVLAFLPSIATADLRVLCESSAVPSHLRPHIRRELSQRLERGTAGAKRTRPREAPR